MEKKKEEAKKPKKLKGLKPKKKLFKGWDDGRPLDPHSLDHLPTHVERLPMLLKTKSYIYDEPDYKQKPVSVEEFEDSADATDEAKLYMAKHHINELFERLLVGLVDKQPSRPLDYLIDQVRDIMAREKIRKSVEEFQGQFSKPCSDTTYTEQ